MKMLKKLEAIRKVQGYEAQVKEKLAEIIKQTYDSHCYMVDDFTIGESAVDVTYSYICRGYGDIDYAVVPIKWLDEGFDYKAAFEEECKKAEEKRKQEEAEEKKRKEAAKKKATKQKEQKEHELYLKLKKKYEKA